jgi:hypothetical protein
MVAYDVANQLSVSTNMPTLTAREIKIVTNINVSGLFRPKKTMSKGQNK